MKKTEPKEVCPFCGGKFAFKIDYTKCWGCWDGNDHFFEGPDFDNTGEGIDKLVRQMRARILKEANND